MQLNIQTQRTSRNIYIWPKQKYFKTEFNIPSDRCRQMLAPDTKKILLVEWKRRMGISHSNPLRVNVRVMGKVNLE